MIFCTLTLLRALVPLFFHVQSACIDRDLFAECDDSGAVTHTLEMERCR